MKLTLHYFFNNYFRSIFSLTILCLIIYFNSLQDSFHFDDREMLDPPYTANLETFLKEVNFLFTQGKLNFSNIKNRPVLLLTYALNNEIEHHKVFSFHLINLLFHSLTTILIFYILRSLELLRIQLNTNSFSSKNVPIGLAFLTAAIFSTHPLCTQSVVYISARSSLLATFFSLFSLYCFIQIFIQKNIRVSSILFWSALVLLSFYLGLASKLIVGALPAILGSWFLFVICPVRFPGLYSLLVSKRMIIVYLLGLIGSLLVVSHLFFIGDSGVGLYGRIGYLLLQTKVIVFYYLRLFLFPINQSLDPAFPYSTIEKDPLISISIFILSTLVIWVLAKGNHYLKVAVLGFLFALAPTSSVIPLNDLVMEHRMYFPLAVGLCLMGGFLFFDLSIFRRVFFTAFLLISLGTITVSRNQVWHTEETLWWSNLEKNPKNSRAYNNLGYYYYNKKKLDYAVHLFEKSTLLNFKNSNYHYNLANSYFDMHRFKETEREYLISLKLNPEFPEFAHFGLGGLYMKLNRTREALEEYKEAIEIRHARKTIPYEYPLAQLGLGRAYGALGIYKDAIRELASLVKSEPNMHKAHYNLGVAYMKLGQFDKSEEAFLQSLKIKPSHKEAMFSLAIGYQTQGERRKSDKYLNNYLSSGGSQSKAYLAKGINALGVGENDVAKSYFIKAADLDPLNVQALANLGNLAIQENKMDLAKTYLEKALKVRPNFYQLHIQLGIIALQTRNNNAKAEIHFREALKQNIPSKDADKILTLIQRLKANP